MRKALTGTALLLSIVGASVNAQSGGVPKEFPPADFQGNQFVDSEGCAFIRAGISGNTRWVPRVNSRRQQLCNFQPSFDFAAAEDAPNLLDADPEAAEASVAQLENPPLIIFPNGEEVASRPAPVAPRPVPAARPAPAPAAPAVAQAPAAPAPAPAVEAPAPQITLAEACDGKFGPQPGFTLASTGETLDCGPAPVIAAAPQPAPAPAIVPEPVAEDGPLQMTLAEICEAAAAGTKRFVDATTGAPITCPTSSAIAQAPVVKPAEQTPGAMTISLGSGSDTCPEIPAGGDHTVRCGPQADRPWTLADSDDQPARTRRISLGAGPKIPASNPAPSAVAAAPRTPAGYSKVWNDGRLNSQRGLPQTASAAPVQQTAATPYRYIQVGSFGVHANADRLAARLRGLGLSTASGTRGSLKIVAVGPFNNRADMQRALGQVRGLGFSDAYPRN